MMHKIVAPSGTVTVRTQPCIPCEAQKRREQIERELATIAAASAEIVERG